jgi:chorismate mutase
MAALALADAMLAHDALLGHEADIEELRYAIDAVDERIMRAVNERMGLVRQIGACKRNSGLDVIDGERESELIAKWREFSGSLALDIDFAEKLLDLLIEQARKEQ